MKSKLTSILLVIIFLGGLIIFTYPTISDQWNRYHQSQAIASYEEVLVQLDEADLEKPWADARAYNERIVENTFDGDAFSQEEKSLRETEYWSLLNLSDNGIMGYISIPKINQQLPIYHGTSDAVLQIGVGHMSGTKLPIGGEGTHSVLAAHRGLPSAKLFSDLDQMEVGDCFYIHVLDEVLAYEVDQILPMIDKDDYDTLTAVLANEEGEDYVTLFTCTPYGVNSHRLLVRGERIEYHGEEVEEVATVPESMLKSIKDYYMLYILGAIAVVIFVTVLRQIGRKIKSVLRRSREEKDE